MPSKEHNNYTVTAFDLKVALLGYFRFKRQCVCVDEFHGADIIADTGREIIEVEVKVTRCDLIKGEMRKARKHQAYKTGRRFALLRPNKFLFCVPERLVDVALAWSAELDPRYGVIGFDEQKLKGNIQEYRAAHWQGNNYFLRVAKSATRLHDDYSCKLWWAIAKRTSAMIVTLMQGHFERNIQSVKRDENGEL